MTGIQDLKRKHPDLPLSPGKVERHQFEYIRHGTLTGIFNSGLAAGLTGLVYGARQTGIIRLHHALHFDGLGGIGHR
jgi:hypothetical protein